MTVTAPATYAFRGVVYEDTGTGYDYPLRPAVPGPLGDLLFRIAELAVSVDMGAEYVAETFAEAGMSWVHGGGRREDASTHANDVVRSARRRLAEEAAELDALRDELDARFPIVGPDAPVAPTPFDNEPF